jgi:hypothetical protein
LHEDKKAGRLNRPAFSLFFLLKFPRFCKCLEASVVGFLDFWRETAAGQIGKIYDKKSEVACNKRDLYDTMPTCRMLKVFQWMAEKYTRYVRGAYKT